MKVAFCGSGHFAELCLKKISSEIKIEWVITNAPKPAGRGMELHPTAVQLLAEESGIECKTTARLSADEELINWITAEAIDVIIVVDFGHIVKEPILSHPEIGCINIHPSRLPQFRGAAPLQRAIMSGLDKTAVTVFRLNEGMDSGPVLCAEEVEIKHDETYEQLLEKTAEVGSEILLHYIKDIPAENWIFTEQEQNGVSLAPKINKAEGHIEWSMQPDEVINKLRAIRNTPGVFTFFKKKRIRLFEAEKAYHHGKSGELVEIENGYPIIACGEASIKLIEVQPEGKKRQSAKDWLMGARLKKGDMLEA